MTKTFVCVVAAADCEAGLLPHCFGSSASWRKGNFLQGKINRFWVLLLFAAILLIEAGCGSSPTSQFLADNASQLSLKRPGTISATQHPLVAQYELSVPNGSQVSVEFGTNTSYGRFTSSQPAPVSGGAVDVLVAGMRANTVYHMRARVELASGTTIFDSDHTFTTGPLPTASFPTVTVPTGGALTAGAGVDLVSSLNSNVSAVVLDHDGSVVWYYYDPNLPEFAFPIRQIWNGNFLVNFGADLREVDLAGRIVREITLDQVNAGLAAAGYSLQAVEIHHDVIELPNGHLILLMNETRVFQDLPGYPGTTPVTGDDVVDLVAKTRPVWVWRAFDHLDINRHPFLFPDWTHANAIVYTPDGNLLLSLRHQSWVLKIDYANGAGAGDILWRLGPEGDFSLSGGDPAQWFYTQHFPALIQTQGSQFSLALYDNGDTRPDSTGQICDGTCYSRGIIMNVDESARTAQVSWQYAPGWYSYWGGSIALLPKRKCGIRFNDSE